MDMIERVKEWVQKNGIPFEVDFGEGDHDEEFIRSVDILDVLASLSAERCVWANADRGLLGFHDTACGNRVAMNMNFKYCPYCGKRIEVKEEGNG